MAPRPKPPGQRRRERPTQAAWRQLPAAKAFKRPAAKAGWSAATKAWWNALWASPMATTYLEADLPALLRLAEMVELRGRGKLGATETVAMLAIEDRFGLNPKARRALQWEISQAEGGKAKAPANVPRLKLVESA